MALKRTPIPIAVDLADEGRLITVTWQDGVTEFTAYDLRIQCPCARCVDEFSGRRILDPDSVNGEVAASGYSRVGRYALQIQWNDGHSTGIYTYERLREGFTNRE